MVDVFLLNLLGLVIRLCKEWFIHAFVLIVYFVIKCFDCFVVLHRIYQIAPIECFVQKLNICLVDQRKLLPYDMLNRSLVLLYYSSELFL